MIDTHCHVDLFPKPLQAAQELEHSLSACVAVTQLPSHYALGVRHLLPFKRIHPSLGFHPLKAGSSGDELALFLRMAPDAGYVGEIGLDGSADGKSSLGLQKAILAKILPAIRPGAFVSVHSRAAWQETLELLQLKGVGPVCFHYFTGGADGLGQVLKQGHYLSVNHRMLGERHRKILERIPLERMLAETDAPFLGERPGDQLQRVYDFIGEIWSKDSSFVCSQLLRNFEECRVRSNAA